MAAPNILFLMTDQLRPDHVGFMPGSKYCTPNLDAIASEGTVFSNCQSVHPVCMPARAALLTGRYPHQIGCLQMSGDLNFDLPTYPQALQRAGYWTGLVGKLHVLQTWPWSQSRGQGIPLHNLQSEVKGLGFDWVWESAGKQLAVRNHCDWCVHLAERGILEAARDFLEACGPNHNVPDDALLPDGKPWPLDEADHVDVVTADKALQALRERDPAKPFFLKVSFCSPHKPFDPPQRYLDMEPEDRSDDFLPAPDGSTLSSDMKETLWRLRRAYRATLRLVDDQVGRIVAELKSQGLYNNTLIAFSSDHGEMMGDHGRVQKQIYWRESLTVPTFVRMPGAPAAQTVSSPVELTDLSATFLDAAGLDPHAALSEAWPAFRNVIPCRSLLPALRDGRAIRNFSFSESGVGWECVQSDTRKYVRWTDGSSGGFREEFYDLQNDPKELINLATLPDEQMALGEHRHHLQWVLATTPPAQHRWAPFGSEHSVQH